MILVALTHTHVAAPLAASAFHYYWTVNSYLWPWGQGILCAGIGFMVAHKTNRSVFNWVFTGLLCGIILLSPIGLAFMAVAYFAYPLAPPEYQSRRILGARRRASRSERDEAIRRDERRRRGMEIRRK